MNRITEKMLQARIDLLNEMMDMPTSSYTKMDDGSLKANKGNYHLSLAYGGACLHQMLGDSGGVRDVFSCGHIPKRELFDRINAMIAGIHEVKNG